MTRSRMWPGAALAAVALTAVGALNTVSADASRQASGVGPALAAHRDVAAHMSTSGDRSPAGFATATKSSHPTGKHHGKQHAKHHKKHASKHPTPRTTPHTVTSTAVAPTASAGPSGALPPSTNPAGWNLAFSDNFTGNTLSKKWFTYSGQPGGDPAGWFAGSHVTVDNGMVHILGYRDARYGGRVTTGGLSTAHGFVQTYGKYLVRMRADSGQGVSYAALLWPTTGGWPPEIDFAEDNGRPGRGSLTTTLHWKTPTVRNATQHAVAAVDMTRWHTVGVEWSPGRVTYTLDGKAWSTIDNPNVSTAPMALALQTQAWYCGHSWETCPSAATPTHVDMDVDWVVAYSRNA